MKEYIQGQEKKLGVPENSNRLAQLNEEDPGAISYFQFNEAVYFEAVVDMKEWI
jgi:hypothetical protein